MQLTTLLNRFVLIFICYPLGMYIIGAPWWAVSLPYLGLFIFISLLILFYKLILPTIDFIIDINEYLREKMK